MVPKFSSPDLYMVSVLTHPCVVSSVWQTPDAVLLLTMVSESSNPIQWF